MDMLSTLAKQLQQLRKNAEQIDLQPALGKPQNWFDTALFSCRSASLTDYVVEAQRNLQHLQHNSLSDAARLRLVQHLSEQTAAITRAFRNVEVRRKSATKHRNIKAVVEKVSASSRQLYQQLSEIQEFERRLLDMIALANRDNSPQAVQRALALHARLGRCRQAMSDVEQQIQDLERRN